jgi:hypothetical protein
MLDPVHTRTHRGGRDSAIDAGLLAVVGCAMVLLCVRPTTSLGEP